MSNSTPQQFEYKAYDSDRRIVSGRESANNFQHLALTLRQKGLQVLEAVTVDSNQAIAEERLDKMKNRVIPPPSLDEHDAKPGSSIRSLIAALIHLLRRG